MTGSAEASRDALAARDEAARLEARLAVARDRLDALLPPTPPRSPESSARAGVARFDDDDNVDPHLRELLRPAAARVTRLLELAGSVADGTLTDAAAAEAAGAIADTQPYRRPR